MEAVIAGLALIVSLSALIIGEFRAKASFRVSWTDSVIRWSRECVNVMAVMEHDFATVGGSGRPDAPKMDLVFDRLASLSSLIDEGRFFFENNQNTSWGANKPKAYRGFRPILIDCLVAAYQEYSKAVDSSPVSADAIHHCRRQFVSHVQPLVDPRWFAKKAEVKVKSVEVGP